MWKIPELSGVAAKGFDLTPHQILDEYDGPRLFTVVEGSDLYLVYQCGEDGTIERFLIVPTNRQILKNIENSTVTLRDALTSSWAWIADRRRDGSVDPAVRVDPSLLPQNALPRPGVTLHPPVAPLLRIKVSGSELPPQAAPASVVTDAVKAATGAVRSLAKFVLGGGSTGRPAEEMRRLYNLPATRFSFGSLEIEFGAPPEVKQGALDIQQAAEKVRLLLQEGLCWLEGQQDLEDKPREEKRAVIEAMSHLVPPRRGSIETVEVSGVLISKAGRKHTLTRKHTEKVDSARFFDKDVTRILVENGLIREFDKDQLSFILRDRDGKNIRSVNFSDELFDDVYEYFDRDVPVTIVTRQTADIQTTDLISVEVASL